MEKKSVTDVLNGTCVTDLYSVPRDAKIWRVYHVYGDYEMPLNLFIDSNNMITGVDAGLTRFYVGKVGEKCMFGSEEVAPITLYFMDHHMGRDRLGNDVCHQEGLQNYYGYVFFSGSRSYLWNAHGEYFADHGLPYSDGYLFSEIKGLENQYLQDSLRAFVYAMFGHSCRVSPEMLPIVQTIRNLTAESGFLCSEDDFNKACSENAQPYDLGGHVFCKKIVDVPAYRGLFPLT